MRKGRIRTREEIERAIKTRRERGGFIVSEETKRKAVATRMKNDSYKNCWSEESKENARQRMLGNKFRLGIVPYNKGMKGIIKNGPPSIETRNKISKTRLERNIRPTKEIIDRIKEKRAQQKNLWKSKTEKHMLKLLDELNIKHENKLMEIEDRYRCDAYISSMNMVIECDGDVYHNYPYGNLIDHYRTQELQMRGIKVLRIWGRDIDGHSWPEFTPRHQRHLMTKEELLKRIEGCS